MIPVSFILDRKGTIQFVHHGPISDEQLTAMVKEAADFAGVPRPIPVTEPPLAAQQATAR